MPNHWPAGAHTMQREEGQDLAEYAILMAVIVIAVIAALMATGTQIQTFYQEIARLLAGAL